MSQDPKPSQPSTDRRVSAWWRALACLLLLAALLGWAAAASLVEQLQAQIRQQQAKLERLPQWRQIAVLLDEQGRAALLAGYDPLAGALQIERLNAVKEGREESLQLWALREGEPPRSLGIVSRNYKSSQIEVAPAALEQVGELAVSVERKDGASDAQGPSLPWLFRGWLVRKAI